MGYAARGNVTGGLPRLLRTRLSGLRVAVDVQHLYKTSNPLDRGASFELVGGLHLDEAQAVTTYAQALCAWLTARGAAVLTNHPAVPELVGSYYRRLKEAEKWPADAYLACHLDAGNGSYALVEYVAGSAGLPLATRIGSRLTDDFPEILSSKAVALTRQARGFACIDGFPTDRAAVLVEPFFGDNPRQQGLFSTANLVKVGESIGEGVARWWEYVKASRLA
jgi:N-acetylmuramoyl-L-alanine amidase